MVILPDELRRRRWPAGYRRRCKVGGASEAGRRLRRVTIPGDGPACGGGGRCHGGLVWRGKVLRHDIGHFGTATAAGVPARRCVPRYAAVTVLLLLLLLLLLLVMVLLLLLLLVLIVDYPARLHRGIHLQKIIIINQ